MESCTITRGNGLTIYCNCFDKMLVISMHRENQRKGARELLFWSDEHFFSVQKLI